MAASFSSSDHERVIDFLNTVGPIDQGSFDVLDTDRGAATWLQEAGYLGEWEPSKDKEGALSEKAKFLREILRELVEQRKQDSTFEVERLNVLLAAGSYRTELDFDSSGNVMISRRYANETAEQILTPLAVAGADLLANGNFRLIRKCEGSECPLWFYDKTKAHRRRWCNMALCGNRQKASRYRDRQSYGR